MTKKNKNFIQGRSLFKYSIFLLLIILIMSSLSCTGKKDNSVYDTGMMPSKNNGIVLNDFESDQDMQSIEIEGDFVQKTLNTDKNYTYFGNSSLRLDARNSRLGKTINTRGTTANMLMNLPQEIDLSKYRGIGFWFHA